MKKLKQNRKHKRNNSVLMFDLVPKAKGVENEKIFKDTFGFAGTNALVPDVQIPTLRRSMSGVSVYDKSWVEQNNKFNQAAIIGKSNKKVPKIPTIEMRVPLSVICDEMDEEGEWSFIGGNHAGLGNPFEENENVVLNEENNSNLSWIEILALEGDAEQVKEDCEENKEEVQEIFDKDDDHITSSYDDYSTNTDDVLSEYFNLNTPHHIDLENEVIQTAKIHWQNSSINEKDYLFSDSETSYSLSHLKEKAKAAFMKSGSEVKIDIEETEQHETIFSKESTTDDTKEEEQFEDVISQVVTDSFEEFMVGIDTEI